MFDKIVPIPIPLSKAASALAEVYTHLGIRTGKSRSERFSLPAGRVLLNVVCGLARTGHQLESVHQGNETCILHVRIPSDIWAWKGRLDVSITRAPAETIVEASTRIGGQLFDWGKSNRVLNTVFESVRLQPA